MLDLIIVLISRIAQMVTSLVALRLATHFLEPEEFGTLNMLTVGVMLLALIFISPIGMYINRKLHSWHENKILASRLLIGLAYLLPICFVSAALAIAADALFKLDWKLNPLWIGGLVFLSILFTTINQTLIPSFNMLGHRIAWSILTLITLWSGLFLAWWFTKDNHKAEWWFLGLQLGMAIGSVLGLFFLIKIASPIKREHFSDINKKNLKPVLIFVLPLALAVGLNWTQFQSYRFLLSEWVSLAFLGFFAAGYTVSAGIMNAFENFVHQFYYPIFYKKISNAESQENIQTWQNYVSAMVPLSCLTTLMIALLAKPLTLVLVDEQYHENAHRFVVIGAVIELCRVLGNVYALAAHTSMKTKTLLPPQILGVFILALSIFSASYLIPDQTENGIIYGLMAAAGIYVIMMHVAMSRHFEQGFKKKHFWAIPIILISGIAMFFLEKIQWSATHALWDATGKLGVIGCLYCLSAIAIYIRSKKLNLLG